MQGKYFDVKVREGQQVKNADQYYTENSHPAIIDRDTFRRVQALTKRRSQRASAPPAEYPLSRKIVCGECGTIFTRKITRNGYVVWVCRRHDRRAADCPVGRIAESEICAAFVRMYNKLKLHEGIILEPALGQLRDLNDALQKGNPAMLAVNNAIAEATEAVRLANAINRGLEHPDKPEEVVASILCGISARYDCCPAPTESDTFNRPAEVDLKRFGQAVSYITIPAWTTAIC